ncbi:Phenylalanine 4-hydroxylase [Ekhidna lutea]|uniref:Phenylalanine 4-hydroxylase n=1 Tax=Ekhidna lutea TaxID=447679 RepID=A0A239M288_EKHLU|nr:phenylalanine 4-monooxygenase [Ekhidna lutea]SNT36422.1 Phenylalanine 4-hydroxylase [Ekhidna lutea]
MRQIYDNYTQEDFEVWKILFDRQMKQFPTHACDAYKKGLKIADFETGLIPDFKETNQILQDTTGWQLAVVPGIVPDYTFFELMANKRFPATTWLRKMKELDYLEEPDMFHDVFAHVPLLTNQHFVNFLEELSKIGLEYVGNDYAIQLLSRVYWFTVEFGLIQEKEGLRIYGAGILSSAGETKFSLSEEPPKHKFSIEHMLETGYRKDVFQTEYFITESYEQLYNSIPEIKKLMQEKLAAIA